MIEKMEKGWKKHSIFKKNSQSNCNYRVLHRLVLWKYRRWYDKCEAQPFDSCSGLLICEKCYMKMTYVNIVLGCGNVNRRLFLNRIDMANNRMTSFDIETLLLSTQKLYIDMKYNNWNLSDEIHFASF